MPWIEQLVAESTGKKKKGIIPIEAEPLTKADRYGKDRVFVFLRMSREKHAEAAKLKDALLQKRVPIVDLELATKSQLGAQFLLWEAATAVIGWYLRINPVRRTECNREQEQHLEDSRRF